MPLCDNKQLQCSWDGSLLDEPAVVPLLAGRRGLLGHADRAHRAWEGGREHDGLPVRADVAADARHLGLKAHVEHAVSFVHDQVRHTPQVGDLAVGGDQDVDHAPRGADDHLTPGLQLRYLPASSSTSVRAAHQNLHSRQQQRQQIWDEDSAWSV